MISIAGIILIFYILFDIVEEINKDLSADRTAFFWMELYPVKIVLLQGRTITDPIIGLGDGLPTNGGIKTMHQINMFVFRYIPEQAGLQIGNLVPPDLGNLDRI